MKQARILWEQGDHRIVEAEDVYYVEKRGQADAMGTVAWRTVGALRAEPPRHSRENDDITIPAEVLRGVCEQIRQTLDARLAASARLLARQATAILSEDEHAEEDIEQLRRSGREQDPPPPDLPYAGPGSPLDE